jgi:Ca2+-binding RTX toxin-like protein
LVGDNGANSLFGHLGADTFVGKGGNDSIEAIDGHRDKAIECGGGDDDVAVDRSDPQPSSC